MAEVSKPILFALELEDSSPSRVAAYRCPRFYRLGDRINTLVTTREPIDFLI